MKFIKFFLVILTSFFINSCGQFGDSLFLPGEDPEDIVLYELDNEYLAPESKEYISFAHSSKELNSSYILVGKKTYGFEANLNTNESLSFDEDGALRLERDHPFLADKYKKGDIKNGGKDRDKDDKDRDKDDKDRDKDDKDWDREEKEKCFKLVMPYTLIMPDASLITIETEEDREKVEEWYKNNPDSKDRPSLEYPVDVVIETDEGERTTTVNNDDEMKEIIGRCKKDREEKKKCFELVMPYTLIMPDASLITIETEEDREKVEEWYKNNPDLKDRPSIKFPVDIIVETDEGERTITINNEEEMKKAKGRCERGRRDRDRDDKDKCRKLHGDDIVDCILEYVHFNYPNDEIVHARRLKTKDGDVFYVVKLSDSTILKFNDSCELLD